MSGRILPLPESVRSQLRSGVAIASVAQCVEELVLNSIDAEATCIAVRVDLSIFRIQVVDNGSGVQERDLKVLGNRHSTSKCRTVHDLSSNLTHYGFRGEALASLVDLAAIIDITTRPASSNKTYSKLFTYGKEKSVSISQTSRPSVGTTITIQDFMYNMPVRRKLIKEAIDLENIRIRLESFALMHPKISFSLRNDNNNTKIFQASKTNCMMATFIQLFGSERAQGLAEIHHTLDQFVINGYISTHPHLTKSLQYVFVNKRVVLKTKIHKFMNQLLSHSSIISNRLHPATPTPVKSASSPTKGLKLYGIFVIAIECPLTEYDICLDPRKTLIQFKDWDKVLICIEEMVLKFTQEENIAISIDERYSRVGREQVLEEDASPVPHSSQAFLKAFSLKRHGNSKDITEAPKEKYGRTLCIQDNLSGIQSLPAKRSNIKKTPPITNDESEKIEESISKYCVSLLSSQKDSDSIFSKFSTVKDRNAVSSKGIKDKQAYMHVAREENRNESKDSGSRDDDDGYHGVSEIEFVRKTHAEHQKERCHSKTNDEDNSDGTDDVSQLEYIRNFYKDKTKNDSYIEWDINREGASDKEYYTKGIHAGYKKKVGNHDNDCANINIHSQKDGNIQGAACENESPDVEDFSHVDYIRKILAKRKDEPYNEKASSQHNDEISHVKDFDTESNPHGDSDDTDALLSDSSHSENENEDHISNSEIRTFPKMNLQTTEYRISEKSSLQELKELYEEEIQNICAPESYSTPEKNPKGALALPKQCIASTSLAASKFPSLRKVSQKDCSRKGSQKDCSRKGSQKDCSSHKKKSLCSSLHENMMKHQKKVESLQTLQKFEFKKKCQNSRSIGDCQAKFNKFNVQNMSSSSRQGNSLVGIKKLANSDNSSKMKISQNDENSHLNVEDNQKVCSTAGIFKKFECQSLKKGKNIGNENKKNEANVKSKEVCVAFQQSNIGNKKKIHSNVEHEHDSKFVFDPVLTTHSVGGNSSKVDKSITKHINDENTDTALYCQSSYAASFPILSDRSSKRVTKVFCKSSESNDIIDEVSNISVKYTNGKKELAGSQLTDTSDDNSSQLNLKDNKNNGCNSDIPLVKKLLSLENDALLIQRKDTCIGHDRVIPLHGNGSDFQVTQSFEVSSEVWAHGECNPTSALCGKVNERKGREDNESATVKNVEGKLRHFVDSTQDASLRDSNVLEVSSVPIVKQVYGESHKKNLYYQSNEVANQGCSCSSQNISLCPSNTLSHENVNSTFCITGKSTLNKLPDTINSHHYPKACDFSIETCRSSRLSDHDLHSQVPVSMVYSVAVGSALVNPPSDVLEAKSPRISLSESNKIKINASSKEVIHLSSQVESQVESVAVESKICSPPKVYNTKTQEEQLPLSPSLHFSQLTLPNVVEKPSSCCTKMSNADSDIVNLSTPVIKSLSSSSLPKLGKLVKWASMTGHACQKMDLSIKKQAGSPKKQSLTSRENEKRIQISASPHKEESCLSICTEALTDESRICPHTNEVNAETGEKQPSLSPSLHFSQLTLPDVAEDSLSQNTKLSNANSDISSVDNHIINSLSSSSFPKLNLMKWSSTNSNAVQETDPSINKLAVSQKNKILTNGESDSDAFSTQMSESDFLILQAEENMLNKKKEEELYACNSSSKESLVDGWKESCDSSGKKIFVNLRTGNTSYEQPIAEVMPEWTSSQPLGAPLLRIPLTHEPDYIPYGKNHSRQDFTLSHGFSAFLSWKKRKDERKNGAASLCADGSLQSKCTTNVGCSSDELVPSIEDNGNYEHMLEASGETKVIDGENILSDSALRQVTQDAIEELLNDFDGSNASDKWLSKPSFEKNNHSDVAQICQLWEAPEFAMDADILQSEPQVGASDGTISSGKNGPVRIYNIVHPYKFAREMLLSCKVIGQVDNKFIACKILHTSKNEPDAIPSDLIVLFDQHAVHERVRLETIIEENHETTESGKRVIRSSMVTPPMTMTLPDDEVRLMIAYSGLFRDRGIHVSKVSTSKVCFHAIPNCLVAREAAQMHSRRYQSTSAILESCVRDMCHTLHTTGGIIGGIPKPLLYIFNSQACRSAVKFGDELSLAECQELINSLTMCQLPFQCAHGRPSIVPVVSLTHLAKFEKKDRKLNIKKLVADMHCNSDKDA